MKTISDKGVQILKFLATSPAEYKQPTKIGEACGKSYYCSSAWASAGLKTLERNGYVERNNKGHWRLTAEGIKFCETL